SALAWIEIRAIESQYTEGTWGRVVADIRWTFQFAQVSAIEVRSAEATGHRIAAEVLEGTAPMERWIVATEVLSSGRQTVKVRVGLELANGDRAEMERAKELLTEVTARLR